MTGSRPSTARKVTPKSEAARKAKMDPAISIRVDGVVHTVRPADITGLVEYAFRKQTDLAVMGLLNQLNEQSGIDTIAAFVFLAKLQAGAETSFNAELAAIDYGTDIEDDPETEPAPAPEA